MKQDIEEDLSEPLTRLEFYRKVAPLVTRNFEMVIPTLPIRLRN